MRYGRLKAGTLVLAFFGCLGSVWAAGVARPCAAAPGTAPFRLNQRSATRLLLSEPRPHYPPLARINYIRGKVAVLLTVDCAGRVMRAHVVRGHPFLAAAALQAIKKWVYRPFVTAAGPAAFQTTVKVDFSLIERNLRSFPPEPDKFLARSVRPPRPPKHSAIPPGHPFVTVRVLVSETGLVVDCTQLSGTVAQFEEARQTVSRWRFRPARWGNLSVPWYAEARVPVDNDAGTARLRAARNEASSLISAN
ncbi:MAG: TonB family protein [Terriglobia bacterium]